MSNHVDFDERLRFVEQVLGDNGLKPLKIEPLEYEPDFPFPYNNFIYHVYLKTATISSNSPPNNTYEKRQPGTSPLPPNPTSLILRLTNSKAMGLNPTNRVANEVASMHLVRDALKSSPYSNIIPAIYAWSNTTSTIQGYTMQEYMPGITLDSQASFEKMGIEDKKLMLKQMAEVLKLIQGVEIPVGVEGFGGLKFGGEGDVVGGEMTICQGGPFGAYREMWLGLMRGELENADKSVRIGGWRENAVRERLEKFMDEGVLQILEGLDLQKRVLVHSDFTTNNVLFNPKTLQLTALLDFDFSHISHPADEFLRSFATLPGGQVPPPNSTGDESMLRKFMLEGFPPGPQSSDWEVARAWDEALCDAGVLKPAMMGQAFEKLEALNALVGRVCPMRLSNETVMRRRSKEELIGMRGAGERWILEFLEAYGF